MTIPWLEWGAAVAAWDGRDTSGDLHVIVRCDDDTILAGAVDGLGHGRDAGRAAALGAAAIEHHRNDSLLTLATRCHSALVGTRGVVMSLARFDPAADTVAWMGVGNVEGVIIRHRPVNGCRTESLLQRRGVVGIRLPPLSATMVPIAPGDLLIFTTDGIGPDFEAAATPDAPVQAIADRILAEHRRGDDDALALVLRYRGHDAR